MKFKLLPALISLAVLGAAAVPASAADRKTDGLDAPTAPLQTVQEAAPSSAAAQGYPVEVDGQNVAAGVCVMVPLRAVAEPLGFTVTWDDGGVLVDNGTIHTRVTIGVDQYVLTTSSEELVGMSAPFSLGAAPYVSDGVTYVPLGLFNALLGHREDAVVLDDNKIVIRTESTELANPFVSCETIPQAQQIAGFSLELPAQIPDWAGQPAIRALDSAMIEVTYEGQGRELVIRKGVGNQDISGDYNTYDSEETIAVDGCPVTVKGSGGKTAVAVWIRSGYTYAVSAVPGLELEELTALVSGIR